MQQNLIKARLGHRRVECVENLALDHHGLAREVHHAKSYTCCAIYRSVLYVGTGQD